MFRFIPAALTARPWDFGEETIRDRIIAEEEKELLKKEPIDPSAIVKIGGPDGEEAQAVVVGVGKGVAKGKRSSPLIPWKPGTPKNEHDSGDGKKRSNGEVQEPVFTVPGAPKAKPIDLPKHDDQHDKLSKGEPGSGFDVPTPPDIPIMPIFAVQGTLSSSAPASPARTTPPTPARAKFGGRHKAFKARPSKKGKEEKEDEVEKEEENEKAQAGRNGDKVQKGKKLKGILRPPVQVAVSCEVITDKEGGEELVAQDEVKNAETDYAELAPLAILPADGGEADSTAGIATESDNPAETMVAEVPDTRTTRATDTSSVPQYTLMSRAMRRVVGTIGRMRSAIPYALPSADATHRIDPYPLIPADIPGTPAAFQYTDTAKAGAQTIPSLGEGGTVPVQSASQGTSSKKRALLPWSFHSSGVQTARESRRSSRVAVPFVG